MLICINYIQSYYIKYILDNIDNYDIINATFIAAFCRYQISRFARLLHN